MTRWFAIYCEAQRELYARDRLLERGFSVFCPFEKVTKNIPVRSRPGEFIKRSFNVPVYASYAFVQTHDFAGVKNTPGVLSFVAVNGEPIPVKHGVIEHLKAVSDAFGLIEKDITKPS